MGFGALRLQSLRVACVRSGRRSRSARGVEGSLHVAWGSEAGLGRLDFASWTVSERVTPSTRPVAWVCRSGQTRQENTRGLQSAWQPRETMQVEEMGPGTWVCADGRRGSWENWPRRDFS